MVRFFLFFFSLSLSTENCKNDKTTFNKFKFLVDRLWGNLRWKYLSDKTPFLKIIHECNCWGILSGKWKLTSILSSNTRIWIRWKKLRIRKVRHRRLKCIILWSRRYGTKFASPCTSNWKIYDHEPTRIISATFHWLPYHFFLVSFSITLSFDCFNLDYSTWEAIARPVQAPLCIRKNIGSWGLSM